MGAVISLSISPLSPILQFLAMATASTILVILVPYTKVEESFSMQAIHDFLFLSDPKRFAFTMMGIPYDNFINNNNSTLRWDHEDFPGVVHRTFIGSFVISIIVKPFYYFINVNSFGDNFGKFELQIISRVVLSLFVIGSFSIFGGAIERKYGSTTRRALSILTLTQFHFLFYSSRALPNTFALVTVLLSCAKWLDRQWREFIILMALTVVVFRADTIILFGWIVLYEVFITKELKILYLFKIGIPSGLVSLAITLFFDSYIWGQLTWPEGFGLWFNVIQNKSHQWGTQPFLWYFYSAIPRAMLLTLIFVPFCCKELLKTLVSITLLFILTYSFLPHKELRFIMYCIPLLNACAANTIAVVIEKYEENITKKNQSYLINLIWNYFCDENSNDKKDSNGVNESTQAKDHNKYDAIPNNRSLRRRGKIGYMYDTEQELDEQYEKITAAQLQISSDKCGSTPNGWFLTFTFIIMAIHVWCNVAATVFMLLAAWHNYPGGESIAWINNQIINHEFSGLKIDDAIKHNNYNNNNKSIGVYVCNFAAQSGFTRFLEIDEIYYNKQPNLVEADFNNFEIIYLILEKSDVHSIQSRCTGTGVDLSCHLGKNINNCKIQKSITGFNGLDFSLSNKVVIKTAPMLWIFRCQR